MAMKMNTLVKVGLLCGSAGICIALILIGAPRYGTDQSVPGIMLSAYNVAFKWLWPTSVILPDYIVGPLDRSFLVARVGAAVLMNGVLYAAIGIALVIIRSHLSTPKR